MNLPRILAQETDAHDVNYVHLFLLLYADDTIVLAETPDDMQGALDTLKRYCDQYGLHVNTEKSKIVIFSRGKIRTLPKFRLNGESVEIE